VTDTVALALQAHGAEQLAASQACFLEALGSKPCEKKSANRATS